MPNINPVQFKQIETKAPNSKAIYSALGDIMNETSNCKAKVASVDPKTGQFQIVLTGTFTGDTSRWSSKQQHANPSFDGE
ncbi:MAG: hypothetical protein L0Y74_10860 [candidate division Zixibacteria bacterium]|nr:hypothetical protein [candidate division Zixibacteria bacterium]